MLTYGPVKVERWKPEQSDASGYLRAGRIILHGSCLTTIGGLACDPYLSMDAGASDTEVGAELLRVLANARVTPVPTDHKAELQKILRTDIEHTCQIQFPCAWQRKDHHFLQRGRMGHPDRTILINHIGANRRIFDVADRADPWKIHFENLKNIKSSYA